MPVRATIGPEPKTIKEFLRTPSFLPYVTRYLGLDCQHACELICLFGMAAAAVCTVFSRMRGPLSLFALWIFYQSIYQYGRTFLWFQWDILLLETGLVAILVSLQACYDGDNDHTNDAPPNLGLWAVKWLLFRLMFASGVVKLQSQCPTWWGLTALDWHYQSQCIPTPLAWYCHHLPGVLQKFSVAMVYVIEIAAPFLFFVPVRALRMVSFYLQIVLQLLIISSGNYNFFNFLTITLCFSLLDSRFFTGVRPSVPSWQSSELVRNVKRMTISLVLTSLALVSARLFNLDPFLVEEPKIMFTKYQFEKFVSKAVPASIVLASVSLGWEILKSFRYSVMRGSCWTVMQCAWAMSGVVAIFLLSLVPFTQLYSPLQSSIPAEVIQAYETTHSLHLVNSYGLFRRMTGVNGRPELVFFGSDDGKKWKEYEFPYKPGNPYRRPPIVAPHQPRLDWQMWFAALSSYEHNDWVLTLGYRLLTSEPSVLALLEHNPFSSKPPRYVKADLYTYSFTGTSAGPGNWWSRANPQPYLTPFDKKDEFLLRRLASQGNLQKTMPRSSTNVPVARFLDALRLSASRLTGAQFVNAVSASTLSLNMLLRRQLLIVCGFCSLNMLLSLRW